MSGYKSLESKKEYILEIKKSIFLSEAKMVSTEEEAINFVNEIRKKHEKATHHCFAYSINNNGLKQKAEDDGEPSGTAGLPILKAINMNDLINVVIVVTRYFGGIKLGAGGLTRAYMSSATGLIEDAGIREFKKYIDLIIRVRYDLYDIISDYIRKNDLLIMDTKYEDEVYITLRVLKEMAMEYHDEFINLTSANIDISYGKEVYM